MGIAELLGEIGSGIGTFLPALLEALLDGFVQLFFVTGTDAAITGLSALGEVSIVFFVISLCRQFIPGVLSWFKTKWKSGKKARKKKA